MDLASRASYYLLKNPPEKYINVFLTVGGQYIGIIILYGVLKEIVGFGDSRVQGFGPSSTTSMVGSFKASGTEICK